MIKVGVAVAVVSALAAIGAGDAAAQPVLNIPFAPAEDSSLKDPDNPTKVFRIDLARVEHQFPLSRADLMKITPDNLADLSQEQVDQIYGRITAGPIPDGKYLGDLFFRRGESLRTRLEEIIGGLGGRIIGLNVGVIERMGGALWKGKVFQRDRRILHNMIDDPARLGSIAIDRPLTLPTTTIAREGRLGRLFPRDTVSLLFPAKVHCGQSLLDTRRESIVIDYAYNDEITSGAEDDGFRKSPDSLAGRGGLRIRDEIRMVRPGLYLGRAYANRMFLLNFTLFNAQVAEREGPAFEAGGPVAEECWPGEQRRTAVR
jgi:hypothetical protein